jgi:hypothetical protein
MLLVNPEERQMALSLKRRLFALSNEAFKELFSEPFKEMRRYCETRCRKDCVGWADCSKVDAFRKKLAKVYED